MAAGSRALAWIVALWALPPAIGATTSSWQTWGPYRPNLYFGVRPQIPNSFLMGLMWASGNDPKTMLNTLRDTCEQDDGMGGYGWSMYDTRVGGSQVLHDNKLQIDITTDFVKAKSGNSWAVRVSGALRPGAPPDTKTVVIFHASIEGVDQDGSRNLTCENTNQDLEVRCNGQTPALGSFHLNVTRGTGSVAADGTKIKSLSIPEDMIWQAKAVFAEQENSAMRRQDNNAREEAESSTGNMHFIQTTFQGPFTTVFAYRGSNADSSDETPFETDLNTFSSAFQERVDKAFPRTPPFQDEKYAAFAQALLSNLLGGLGFFHGDSKVDLTHAPEYNETEPHFWEKVKAVMEQASITTTEPSSLLSFTPSRPFFPRGFLWDEGFHLLPVLEWDLDLAVSVLQSWLGQMDDDGWIAREQILGPEARNKVPGQFQVQYPHYANPPTLSLLFPILIGKLSKAASYAGHPSQYHSSQNDANTMLKELYPLLARHYRWFRRTQAGDFEQYMRPKAAVKGEGYRWRGRTPMHTLTSGLDDYPRANPPHSAELHVDALSWVGASAHALQQVAEYLGEHTDAAMYGAHLAAVKKNIDLLHWDPDEQAYCDSTVESATDNAIPAYKWICHQGYMSLFPLLLGLMDAKHAHLPAVLDLLSDPTKLWSPHGLRSLSALDENYGKDENYWRGAVWVNLNVLAVLRLRDIGLEGRDRGAKATSTQTRALMLAAQLRERLLNTVYDSWEKTGFVWEQYSDKTGEGSHSRAFTGWTACVILLLGLDLRGFAGDDQEYPKTPTTVPPSSISTSAVAMLAVIVIVGIMFRRRLMGLALQLARSWYMRNQRSGRGGRYEQIIDLDELGPAPR
ncbi:glycoside hydrolase [Thozetella sp. PMI_491]|nr:glycoside hydrolase [Thozetella sp. PMI_491]